MAGGGKGHCQYVWRERCPGLGRWVAKEPWPSCPPLSTPHSPAGDAVERPTPPVPGQGIPDNQEEEHVTTPAEELVALGPSGTCSQPGGVRLVRANSRASPTRCTVSSELPLRLSTPGFILQGASCEHRGPVRSTSQVGEQKEKGGLRGASY